jgi:hypothetical protein
MLLSAGAKVKNIFSIGNSRGEVLSINSEGWCWVLGAGWQEPNLLHTTLNLRHFK